MRNLQTHDVFVAMNIINTAGIKEEFSKMALKVSNNKKVNVEEVGIELLLNILGGCANERSEKLIYDFLGGIMEIDPNEIRVMEPLELIENIKKMSEVIPVESWKSFFHSLATLIRK